MKQLPSEREYWLDMFTALHVALILACKSDHALVRKFVGEAADEMFEKNKISLPALQYLDKWASHKEKAS